VVVAALADRPGGVADERVIKALTAETGADPAMVASLRLEGSVGVEQAQIDQPVVERVIVGFEAGKRGP
jgi:hypothetical protein